MRVSRSKKGKKTKVVTALSSALAATALVAASVFIIAPAANAVDAPSAAAPAVATDAPAAPDTTPATPAAAPEAATPVTTTSAPAPAAPAPAPAPVAAAPEPAAPAGAATPTGPTTTAGPATTPAAPAAAATPATSDTKSTAPAPAPAPVAKMATQTSNNDKSKKKVLVCKYVGTPGVDERLQTGQNPISVSVNAIQHNQWDGSIPGYFSDAHNRSYVLAYDHGQSVDVSACPAPVGPPATKKEAVGIYLYKALDPSKAPSWGNAGDQTFCGSKDGSSWFTSLPCNLPTEVCGPGWDYQQDKVKYEGTFNWPSTIKSGVDNIGWPPIYAAKHGHLSELITVPDCAPPVKEHVSGNVTFTDTVCDATTPVGNSAEVTLNGKTTATYTLNGGASQALTAGTLNDSVIGQNGYPAVVHIVLTGEDGSTLVFDHTFATPKSSDDCTPKPTPVHPENVIFIDGCGVSDDSFTVPGTLVPGSTIVVTNPETGDVATFSEYASDQGGYNVSDTTTKAGVRTVQVTFIPLGPAPVAEPGEGDTYTLVTIGGVQYAQWTYTFTDEACPVTIIATPPAPKVNPATCTADGSLPPLQGGEGYTAKYDRPFDGPGKYTATYTAAKGVGFKEGTTVSYDVTVAGKLTENCPTSTPTPTPTHSTTPPTTTTSSNGGNGGANTGLDGRQPGVSASSWNATNIAGLAGGAAMIILALIIGAVVLFRRQRNQGGVEAQ